MTNPPHSLLLRKHICAQQVDSSDAEIFCCEWKTGVNIVCSRPVTPIRRERRRCRFPQNEFIGAEQLGDPCRDRVGCDGPAMFEDRLP